MSIFAGLSPTADAAVTVEAHSDRTELAAGEWLSLTVEATRDPATGDPVFAGATLKADQPIILGGHTARSERPLDDGRSGKLWEFTLSVDQLGPVQIFPLVYLQTPEGTRDSVLGRPITLTILPPPEPPRWPWYVAAGLFIALAAAGVHRLRRRLRARSIERTPLPSPIEEARQMLAEAREHLRTDRGLEYFADVEGVIYGYLARRLGRPLATATPGEVRTSLKDRLNDPKVLNRLVALLAACMDARFSGRRPDFEGLTRLRDEAEAVLEQVEGSWV